MVAAHVPRGTKPLEDGDQNFAIEATRQAAPRGALHFRPLGSHWPRGVTVPGA